MLQLTKFYEQCFKDFQKANQASQNSLEEASQKLFAEINQKRLQKSRINPLFYLDHKIWTQENEHLDDPDFDVNLKKEIVQGLHLKNKICGTYNTAIEILRPLIEEINIQEKRPAKILELGSGTGKLTMAVYEEFKKSSLNVELTGSDIVPEYIDQANTEAIINNYNINFRIIDAYHLDKLAHDSYDIVFTLHSMHHFLPEQLITIMAGAQNVASRAFIGIDGHRGLRNLLFIAMSAGGKSALSLNSIFFHDAIISGRRMYSAKQLEIMARMACPGADIDAANHGPGLTVVKILRTDTCKKIH